MNKYMKQSSKDSCTMKDASLERKLSSSNLKVQTACLAVQDADVVSPTKYVEPFSAHSMMHSNVDYDEIQSDLQSPISPDNIDSPVNFYKQDLMD